LRQKTSTNIVENDVVEHKLLAKRLIEAIKSLTTFSVGFASLGCTVAKSQPKTNNFSLKQFNEQKQRPLRTQSAVFRC